MIVNYASCIVNKLEALLTDDSRVVINDRHVFIVQATEVTTIPSLWIQSTGFGEGSFYVLILPFLHQFSIFTFFNIFLQKNILLYTRWQVHTGSNFERECSRSNFTKLFGSIWRNILTEVVSIFAQIVNILNGIVPIFA